MSRRWIKVQISAVFETQVTGLDVGYAQIVGFGTSAIWSLQYSLSRKTLRSSNQTVAYLKQNE
jgi:hypothetical protein